MSVFFEKQNERCVTSWLVEGSVFVSLSFCWNYNDGDLPSYAGGVPNGSFFLFFFFLKYHTLQGKSSLLVTQINEV